MKRFWSRVKKTKTCWIWKGGIYSKGYGRFTYKGDYYLAHRFSWFLTFGYLPTKLLCHKCDNPSCVRPDHLFEGTYKDNHADMMAKGRGKFSYGENHGRHKLNNNQVLQIRELYKQGNTSLRKLSAIFGVSNQTIWSIVTNETWKNI